MGLFCYSQHSILSTSVKLTHFVFPFQVDTGSILTTAVMEMRLKCSATLPQADKPVSILIKTRKRCVHLLCFYLFIYIYIYLFIYLFISLFVTFLRPRVIQKLDKILHNKKKSCQNTKNVRGKSINNN